MNQPKTTGPDVARDELTGLPTLDSVRLWLDDWIGQYSSDEGAPSIHALLLGLRRFDTINLAYGAATGDSALAEVAVRLTHFASEELDGPWVAARGGGGSFLLVANEVCSRERWQLFAEGLADAIARPISRGSGKLRLSPRVALLRVVPGTDAESILDRLANTSADLRRIWGRRVLWADGATGPIGRSAAQLEADLLDAIDHDEIEILYQPQFSTVNDALIGAEALARWNHPTLGRLGASALFSIAERADYVAPLSRHVVAKALQGAARWGEGLRLSLNVTPADIGAASFAGGLMELIRDSGFAPDRLTLEVTEHVLLNDIRTAAQAMRQLAAEGIQIALDDFGAGFCNFHYLKALPLHGLKLDRSMVDGIVNDPRDLAVLRGIVAMARALDLEVIAEGIESEDQRAIVAAEGCAYYQGFLKAPPLTGEEFAALAEA